MANTISLTHTNVDRKVVQTQVEASFRTEHLAVHRPVEPKFLMKHWVVSHAATGYSVARFVLRRQAVEAARVLEEAGGDLWALTYYDDPRRWELYTRLADSGVLSSGRLAGRCGS